MFNYNPNYLYFYTIVWFQLFLLNTNNFQIDLFDPLMGP